MWPFSSSEPPVEAETKGPSIPGTIPWRNPERQALAWSMVQQNATLTPQQQAARMDEFQLHDMRSWPELQALHLKQDQLAADVYADPASRKMIDEQGLEAFQRRYPSIPPPPVTDLPLDPSLQGPRTAIAMPPVDQPTTKQILETLQQADELRGRLKAGAGGYDAYKAQQGALATKGVEEYFKTGDPRFLGGPGDTAGPPQGSEQRETGRKLGEERRKEDAAIAERLANVRSAAEQIGALKDLVLGPMNPQTGQRQGSPLRAQPFGGTGSVADLLDRGAYIVGQEAKAMSGHQGLMDIERSKKILRSTLAKALGDQKGNLNIYEQEAIDKALAGITDTIPSATANFTVIEQLLAAKVKAIQSGRTLTAPTARSAADAEVNAAFLSPTGR